MTRWMRFLIMIIIGAALGLVYGWVVDPVEYVDTTPDTLRQDYKTDFVLMVAEMYQADQDIDLAVQRLRFLGDEPPRGLVQDAIVFAAEVGYPVSDLNRLQALYERLQTYLPVPPGSTP